ncbi:hypothetical protein [Nitrosopumilus ureiphilus]|uniref:DOD-type homing endonuclease domain-containing protein n=1 Tax=Nitrosopumilus ureiphilus TaxID=1470067 RepID=A0A7D5M2S4_9ARCH|nr:hypothetical protein C5F50_00460 [Nitrosopumilus ureiphilus]
MTDIVLGMGEVGETLFNLLVERNFDCVGIDLNESKCKNYSKNMVIENPEYLHVCLPGELKEFDDITINWIRDFKGLKGVLIHSTVKPGTTEKIQKRSTVPVLFSPVRGVHRRFLEDIKKYTKFISSDDKQIDPEIKSDLEKRFKKIDWMSTTKTAELAKILVDTTYYGWLINYAQITKMICDKEGVDFDEMWKFADEIHKNLDNRPKMYPGVIGGHCLDGNEILFIKTQIGMRPITISEYVEKGYQNDVLSYDPIKKKSIFDKVITKWKRQFSGKMISLTTRTNRSITTTDEHVMIVSDSLSEKLAKDIKVDDNIPFVADLPNMDTKQSFNFESTNWRFRHNMPESISITPEFCRLLGYYVSEGSVSNYGKGYSTRFSFNKNEIKYISDVCKILEHLELNYYITTQKNVTHVGVKSTPFSLFVADTLGCGRESNSKCLPEFIFFVSREMKEQFVSGYFRGDGSFMPSLGLVQAGTVSKILVAGLDLLLLSMGYVMTLTSGTHSPSVIEGRTISGKMLYTLVSKKEVQYNKLASISGFTKSQIHRQHNKNLWHMINENLYMIKTTKTVHEEKDQDVYSIDTENHLFVSTGGRLIHNCVIPNLSLVDYENLDIIKKVNELYEKSKN